LHTFFNRPLLILSFLPPSFSLFLFLSLISTPHFPSPPSPGVTANLSLNVCYPTTPPYVVALSTTVLVAGHSTADLAAEKEWANGEKWDDVLDLCAGVKSRLMALKF